MIPQKQSTDGQVGGLKVPIPQPLSKLNIMELIQGPPDINSKDKPVNLEITEVDGFLGIGVAKKDWMDKC